MKTRYIYQVFRNTPKELVFAQTLFGFELAAADPRIVAINFVGAEDDVIAMADYAEHMRMIGFLRALYPNVHVSLHAGELAPGLVPPEGLCCHVRLAVEQALADRIGHGVDVMYEDRPYDLLKHMADKGVLVETNLTSNKVILGVEGKTHPFATYRKFGVPVALSTDDEGVSRIDLTHEYVSAVEDFGLTYAELKELVRNSLEYSFLPGPSLWDDIGAYRARGAGLPSRRAAARCAVGRVRHVLAWERKGATAMGARAAFQVVRGEPLSGCKCGGGNEMRLCVALRNRGGPVADRLASTGAGRLPITAFDRQLPGRQLEADRRRRRRMDAPEPQNGPTPPPRQRRHSDLQRQRHAFDLQGRYQGRSHRPGHVDARDRADECASERDVVGGGRHAYALHDLRRLEGQHRDRRARGQEDEAGYAADEARQHVDGLSCAGATLSTTQPMPKNATMTTSYARVP